MPEKSSSCKNMTTTNDRGCKTTNIKRLLWHHALLVAIIAVISWFTALLITDTACNVYAAMILKARGIKSMATVLEYKPETVRTRSFWSRHSRMETRHIHVISYNGFIAEIDLDHQHPIHNRVSIIYDRNNSGLVWQNTIPLTTWKLLTTNMRVDTFAKGDIFHVIFYNILGTITLYILVKVLFREIPNYEQSGKTRDED